MWSFSVRSVTFLYGFSKDVKKRGNIHIYISSEKKLSFLTLTLFLVNLAVVRFGSEADLFRERLHHQRGSLFWLAASPGAMQ